MGTPAEFQDGEAEVSVLTDRVARPTARGLERGPSNQAHGAVHNDGIGLVALDHADVEEAGIFAIHGGVHDAAITVSVILRCLHKRHARILESRDEILEPVGMHYIIGIEHADDLSIGSRVRQSKVQGTGFEAFELLHVDKFEALAESSAILLDRTPQRGLWRVVD